MVTFDEFKKSLGPTAKNMTNDQIDRLRHALDHIADAGFYRLLIKRNTAKDSSLVAEKAV